MFTAKVPSAQNLEDTADWDDPPKPPLTPKSKPDSKSFIKATVGIHDRTQVEVVFAYFPKKDEIPARMQSYQVDAWLFVPPAMGVTPQSYPKERFYSDLRPLLRLREPKLNYKELLGEDRTDEKSPLSFLRNYIEGTRAGTVSVSPELAVDEVHLFSCSYLSFCYRKLKRRVTKVRKLSKSGREVHEQQDSMEEFEEAVSLIRKSHNILREWRKFRHELAEVGPGLHTSLKAEVGFADEYCSYAFRDALGLFLQALPDCGDFLRRPEYVSVIRRMKAYLRYEKIYSTKAGFMWIDPEGSSELMERYVARRSALKKLTQKVLYLDLRTRPLFAFQQQLGGMLAAAVAGGWAVTADLSVRGQVGGFGITNLGTSGFLIITALIMAYVLKDRIKEIGRNYFSSKFFARIPDNSCSIEYRSQAGRPVDIGSIAEYTRFLSQLRVPDEILKVRETRLEVDPQGGQNVIHYKKRIQLKPAMMSKLQHPIKAVHDILRLNIQSFLTRLDDVLHEEFAFRGNGDVVAVMMPKVYYLDMVLRYSWSPEDDKPSKRMYELIRLVLNKEGLTRVERVGNGSVEDTAG